MSLTRSDRWSHLSQGIPSYLAGGLSVLSLEKYSKPRPASRRSSTGSVSSVGKGTPRRSSKRIVDMASASSKSTQATKGKLSTFTVTQHRTPTHRHSRSSLSPTPFKVVSPFSDLTTRAVQVSEKSYASPRHSSTNSVTSHSQGKRKAKRTYSMSQLSVKYGNVSPRVDCNGYGRGSLIYRSIADKCVEEQATEEETPSSRAPGNWHDHWYYITSSPICRRFLWRNQEAKLKEYKARFVALHEELRETDLINHHFSRIMEIHQFAVAMLSNILSHYDSQRDLFRITMEAFQQAELLFSQASSFPTLLRRRIGFCLWSEKPVRVCIEFLLSLLGASQTILLFQHKPSGAQQILYEAIFEAFLQKPEHSFPLEKVVTLSEDACRYFRISSTQLEEELAEHAANNGLIALFNRALHSEKVYLVDKLRDLTGIDLIMSRRHTEHQLFIIPRDSPYQLLHIISLIPGIDGVKSITNLKKPKELSSSAKYIPYYFKFQPPSPFSRFATSLVAFDKFLSRVTRLSMREFLAQKVQLEDDLTFLGCVQQLRTELGKVGEAGYRALRGALRDKHYEKLVEHLLYSQNFMFPPARYLLLQLLQSLLVVIVRSKEFDFRAFCQVVERVLALRVREAKQVLNDAVFLDKTVIWELRELNAQLNEEIFGIRILPSLSFVKEEIQRILDSRQRRVYVVEGLPAKVWSFYSPACNFIFLGDQDAFAARSLKLRLARSLVKDIVSAKAHVLSTHSFTHSPLLQSPQTLDLPLTGLVSQLYETFKAYPTQRTSEYQPRRSKSQKGLSTARF